MQQAFAVLLVLHVINLPSFCQLQNVLYVMCPSSLYNYIHLFYTVSY